MSITLPNDMADAVKTKVRTGEYASESEVIRDGLRALMARDRAVESWLHNQVGPAYDALKSVLPVPLLRTRCVGVWPLSTPKYDELSRHLHAGGRGPACHSVPLHRACRLA